MKRLLLILLVLVCALPLLPLHGSEAAEALPPDGGAAATPEEGARGLSPFVVGSIVAGALGGGYMYGRKHKIEVDPVPLRVDIEKDFVTRSEHQKDVENLDEKIKSAHKRIDLLAPSVAKIEGKLAGVESNTSRILDILLKRNAK